MAFIFSILYHNLLVRSLSSLIFSLLQISYLVCGLQDPGIIVPSLEINLAEKYFCSHCGASSGGYHCKLCEVCIEGHDHHCGFIGKCVGKGNLYSFYTLMVSVFITIVMVVLSLSFTTYNYKRNQE